MGAQASSAMMSAPSRARASAWLRPWPRAAPVTTATWPASNPVIAEPHRQLPGGPGEERPWLRLPDVEDDRQVLGAQHYADRRLDVRAVRDPEVGHAGEQLAEGDLDLEPGEVHADAPVWAEAEGGVRVALPAEVELVRVLEPGLVPVGGGVVHRHPVARLQRAAAELGVARHGAGHEHDR